VPVAEAAAPTEPAAEAGEQVPAEATAEQTEPASEGAGPATTEAEAKPSAEPQVDEEAVRRHGVAKTRAEKLLKAMGAR